MTTIVTRAGKGSPLTNNEVDTNFTNLNTAKVEGPGASVDGEIALYNSTSGALLKRASITGIVKATGGVAAAAVAGTDYQAAISATGILKGAGSGSVSAATAGTDYQAAISAVGILKGAGSGSVSAATAGTDYAVPGTTTTWTTPQRGTITTDNDGSFDLNVTNNFKCTPTALFTLTFTNIASASGQSGQIILVNTGGYTISAAATTKINTAALTTISAAGTYVLGYICDGTNVYVSNSLALS